MDAIAVSIGLIAAGLVCVVGIVIPVPAERGVALRVLLGVFAAVFFILAVAFAFGWIKA